VTADGGAFDSGNLATGQTFSQTFSAAGTFAYHCNIHPQMTGTVTVTGGAGGGATTTPPAGQTQQPQQQGTAAAPATGSGLAEEGNGSTWPLAVLAAGLAMVVAATAYTVLAVRRR
jgi:hypothetical protein